MNLKILSYNIHKGVGWKWRRATFSYIKSQIHAIGSDVVFLQEIHGMQSEQLTSEFCPYLVYGKNALHKKGHHGNAILSKFPIIFSENIDISMHRFERRSLLHAIIKPDEKKPVIHLLCTHLGLFARGRGKQLDIIVNYINDTIPNEEPVILGGDFNDWSGYATKPLIHHLGFQEAFLMANRSYAKTFPSWIPLLKLDRMYFRGFNVHFAQRLTHKVWRHLSDHIAIEASLNLVI